MTPADERSRTGSFSARSLDLLLIELLRSRFHPEAARSASAWVAGLPVGEQLALLHRARRQEIAPVVARQFMTMEGLAEGSVATARKIYEDNLARNLYLRAETERWVDLFRQAGIPCLPLKGVGASILLFGDVGARTCSDIDLLVSGNDLLAARRIAANQGFEPEGPESSLADPDLKAVHLRPREGSGAYVIDLHQWIELPRLVPVDHAEFWANAGSSMPPLDLVGVVLCLHAWRHAFTLKTLLDFAAYVHRFDDHVTAVGRRLDKARAGRGVTLALALAERVFGVRSRFLREGFATMVILPLLERCYRLPPKERGRYFTWLVFPLQLDGLVRPVGRLAAHVVRPNARDGHLHLGSRLRRLTGVTARAAFRRRRLFHGEQSVN